MADLFVLPYSPQRLELVRTIGDRQSECCTLCNLGNCFRSTGKLEEAMEYYLLVKSHQQTAKNMNKIIFIRICRI